MFLEKKTSTIYHDNSFQLDLQIYSFNNIMYLFEYFYPLCAFYAQTSVLEGEQRDDGHSGSEPDEDARTSTVHISDRSESPASCGMNGGPDDRPTSPSPSRLVLKSYLSKR